MRAAASSFLVLATAATAVTAFNATSQYEFTMKVINHTDDRSWEDSVYRLNVGVDQHTNETGSWATEKLWLQTPEGGEICNTRYAMCAIAFRGGLGNKEINSLFAGDAGDCLGAVDYECVRGIASAAAEGVNSHHSGTYEPGDVEDACLSMNEIAIPESCSNAAVTGELWKDPIAKLIIPPDRECNTSEVTINSYTSDVANSDDILVDYDNMILGITPVIMVAYGGMNMSKVPMPEWENTAYAKGQVMCTRAKDVAGGSRVPEGNEEQQDGGVGWEGEEPNAAISALDMRSFFFVGGVFALSSVFLVM